MMIREQGCPSWDRQRLCVTVARIGVVLAATTGGFTRAGYVYELAQRNDKKSPPAAAPRNEEVEQAVACFQKADYTRCLDLLKAARGKNPELFPPGVILAQWLLRENQLDQARQALEQAAAEEPGCPQTYLLFGKLALGGGRATEAAALFEKALALAGSGGWSEGARKGFLSEARAGLAAVAERRGDWPTAAACLTAWLELDPKNGQVRGRLARSLFRQGKREKVFEELQHAAQDDPALDSPAITMAQLYTETGDPKKAAEWAEYAVKFGPRDPRAHLGAALCYLEQDQPERARALAEAAAKLDPGSAEIKEGRGLIAWHLKDYPEAERLFQELFIAAPGNMAASNLWALTLAEQPSEAKRLRALQLAEANARMAPDSGAVLTTLGRVYYCNGRLEDAERALRAATSRGPVITEAPYYLARVLSERGHEGEVGPLLKLCVGAPGRFAFRAEAREWLARITK
jgi:tetratricopeptide (TPR) repeat protein